MDDIIYYAFALVSLVAGALLGVFIQRHVTSKRIGEANELAQRIVEEARKEAQAQKKEILLQGQNEIFSQKHAFEAECKDQERALKNREKKLQDISDRMEEKMERITQKEHDILAQEKEQTQRERVLAEKELQVEATLDEQERRLQEVSGLTAEEAKARLFEEIESRTPKPVTNRAVHPAMPAMVINSLFLYRNRFRAVTLWVKERRFQMGVTRSSRIRLPSTC